MSQVPLGTPLTKPFHFTVSVAMFAISSDELPPLFTSVPIVRDPSGTMLFNGKDDAPLSVVYLISVKLPEVRNAPPEMDKPTVPVAASAPPLINGFVGLLAMLPRLNDRVVAPPVPRLRPVAVRGVA